MASKTTWRIAGGATLAACAGLTFLLLGMVFFVPYRAPSASMYPSLAPGSRLWIDRSQRKPERGAVLVFRFPENPEQEYDKRVVGLPGDVIATHGPALTINGWEVPRCSVGRHTYQDEDTLTTHAGTIEVEWLGHETYLVFHDEGGLTTNTGPFTVKRGEYFVMGDNRENSHDSRMWFGGMGGGVPEDNTVGRVRMGKLALPRGAESLRGALDACLAKRPSKTSP
jgi:signal peptidase I